MAARLPPRQQEPCPLVRWCCALSCTRTSQTDLLPSFQRALERWGAVITGTPIGKKALGLGDQVGSLEPGKLADVVLIDTRVPELTPLYDVYSQLVYAIKGGHVRHVFVHGEQVVADRELTRVDVKRILAEARRLQQKVLANLEAFRREKKQGR